MKIVFSFVAFLMLSPSIAMAKEPISSLKDFRWEHRLIIGKVNEAKEVERLQKLWKANSEQFKDRKLVMLLVTESGLETEGLANPISVKNDLSKEIVKKLQGKNLALLGLDSGVKARYLLDDFSLEAVFSQIDQMPMRRAELSERNN